MHLSSRRISSCACRATPSSNTPVPPPARIATSSSSTVTPGIPTTIPSLEPLVKPVRNSSTSKPGVVGDVQPLWVPKNRKQRLQQAELSNRGRPQTASTPTSLPNATQSQVSAPASKPKRVRTRLPPNQYKASLQQAPIAAETDEGGEYDEGEELGLSEEENERLVFGTVSNSWEAEVLAAREPESKAMDETGFTAIHEQLIQLGVHKLVADAMITAVKNDKADAGVLMAQAESMLRLAGSGEKLTQTLASFAEHFGFEDLEDVSAMAVTCPTILTLEMLVVRDRTVKLAGTCGCLPRRAAAMMMKNPALLMVPHERLSAKLTALKNSTGLSLEQATSMVTLYMFPGIKG